MSVQAPERLENVATAPTVVKVETGASQWGVGRKIVAASATVVALVVGYEGVRSFVPSLPDIPGVGSLDGGRSDPGATGMVNYEGQTAETSTTRLVSPLGHGTAKVEEKGKRDWDKPGNLFTSFDVVPTNGTSSVRDSKHGDRPAVLNVTMGYCSDGILEKVITPNTKTGVADVKYVYNMGKLTVCSSTLLHTKHNDAQFNQHLTPAWFQGEFDSFMARAAQTTAAAAPCPTKELNKYTKPQYIKAKRHSIAAQIGVADKDVTLIAGTIGESTPEEKASLRAKLKNFTHMKDPKTGKKVERLDINYISGQNTAVEDACYAPIPEKKLSSIGQDGMQQGVSSAPNQGDTSDNLNTNK
ncbi:MAG: hypothetical protein ACXWLH_03455 [Candidatus Saccharimonadales bacterium]